MTKGPQKLWRFASEALGIIVAICLKEDIVDNLLDHPSETCNLASTKFDRNLDSLIYTLYSVIFSGLYWRFTFNFTFGSISSRKMHFLADYTVNKEIQKLWLLIFCYFSVMKIDKIMAKPFLKWAGGKTQLLGEIQKHINYNKTDSFLFVEPFVGSGAVLFWMLNNFPDIKTAVINDVNTDLVNCYKVVKDDVVELIALLHEFEKEYHSLSSEPEKSKLYYYEKRKLFNERTSGILEQSVLFIFLNRTCFNGLFRVNKKNIFNVPQGSYIRPQICNANNLLAVSELLQKVEILNGDFADTIKYASQNSLFYFDPPYKPLSVTSNFNSYAKGDFDDKEQFRLKEFCDQLDELGCKWILSNSDVKGENLNDNFFDDLFKTYRIDRVLARRSINSNAGKRGKLTELLITNNVEHVNAT